MDDTHHVEEQLGDYYLLRPIGRSDFSDVYLAEHIQQHTQVALKRLHGPVKGEDARKFLHHTATLARLQHPHIVAIRDFGIERDVAFLVMDYIPHGSLRQRHPRGARVPLEVILGYVKQVADALYYVHQQGLVHRDVKPHNMLLDGDGRIMLNDFGTVTGSYSLQPEQASLDDFEGTVLYAAPEQLQGKPQRSSDQYALAVVVYEWLCGDWPFSGSFHEIAHQHLFAPPPYLQEKGITLPIAIEQAVLRALEKDPTKRFSSVMMFAEELEWAYKVAHAKGLLQHTATQAEVSSPEPQPPPRRQFKRPLPFTK